MIHAHYGILNLCKTGKDQITILEIEQDSSVDWTKTKVYLTFENMKQLRDELAGRIIELEKKDENGETARKIAHEQKVE